MQAAFEEECAFFVAFSRAKERVLVTFVERRALYNVCPLQTKDKVSAFYETMRNAGVMEFAHNGS